MVGMVTLSSLGGSIEGTQWMSVDRRGGVRDPGKALEVWLRCWATVSLLILDTHAKNVPGHPLGYARVGLLHVSAGCLPDEVMLWPQVAQLDQKPQHLPGSLPFPITTNIRRLNWKQQRRKYATGIRQGRILPWGQELRAGPVYRGTGSQREWLEVRGRASCNTPHSALLQLH